MKKKEERKFSFLAMFKMSCAIVYMTHGAVACDNRDGADNGNLSVALDIHEVKQDGALCNIKITSAGMNIVERGIVYNSASSPTVADHKIRSVKTDLEFRMYVGNLHASGTYSVRAFAKDKSNKVYYSNEVTFTTLVSPTIDPNTVTEIVNDYSGYRLKWSDEFNVNGRPSSKNWDYEKGYVRNQEAQYYSDSEENSEVKDGTLVITARKNHLGHDYTSSSLHTRQNHHFVYGRFEIRAKIPTSSGCWPAIWTVGNKFDWPIGGEIDIMEFYDHSILANAAWSANQAWTAVWDSKKIPITSWTSADPNWLSKYHVWRMDWDNSVINIYLDGLLLNTIDLNTTFNQGWQGNTSNPFRYQAADFGQYFILNLALGGVNGGVIDDGAFPIEYKIDYIRAYEAVEP